MSYSAEVNGDLARAGMAWIAGGAFQMGADSAYPEEAPAHEVCVSGFWIGPADRGRVYCRRYRPAARHPQMVDTGTCHIGFRCVIRPSAKEESTTG